MPQFEIRCNTERILIVEADDQASALEIAERTDFSEWDSLDSPYSIQQRDVPGSVHPVCEAECGSARLRIDLEQFRAQRELLVKITDLARKHLTYTPALGDEQLLDGLLELTDALWDAVQ